MVENNNNNDEMEEETTEHSDLSFLAGLDDDIMRMSADAMSILNSITDEVKEIAQKEEESSSSSNKNKRRTSTRNSTTTTPRSETTGSPHSRNVNNDDGKNHDSDNDNDNVPRLVDNPNTPDHNSPKNNSNDQNNSNQKTILHIDDLDIGEGNGDDEDNFSYSDQSLDESLDESISNELSALRDIQREIERELNFEDEETMQEAMAKIRAQTSPIISRSTKSSKADHEIIQRILNEEKNLHNPVVPSSSPSPLKGNNRGPATSDKSRNILEHILIDRYQLYGPGVGGQELNLQLLVGSIVIWSLLIVFSYREMNAVY